MTRFRLIALSLFTGTTLLLAQAPPNSVWRRFSDPPPAPAAQAQPPAPDAPDQDPSQPVARADSYGQPQQQPAQSQPAQQQRPPAAVPHYGLPAAVTIKTGTFVTVRMNQELSSDRSQPGDVFTASLNQPIVVDGVVVAQRGQSVMGRVGEAVKASHGSGTSRLGLQLTGLTLADGTQPNVQSLVVNHNGQTSVGTNAGAAAATTGVLLTRGHPTVVYPETLLTFRIDTPVNIDLTRAPQAFRFVGPDEYDHPVQTTVTRRPATPGYYTPNPYYYGGYPYPYYYGYPYGYGPYFGIGIGIRGWGRRW